MLYNGGDAYGHSVEFFDLYGKNKALAQEWMFNKFQLIDLNHIADETIREHQWSGLMEMLMKHVRSRDILMYLEQVSEIVKHLVEAKANNYVLAMIKYMIEKSQIEDRNDFYEWLQSHLSPPLEVEAMTFAEKLRVEGRAEGELKGRAEGRLEGERLLVRKQLALKFTGLVSSYEDTIKEATSEELLRWGERILYAQTIEDVFKA